MRRLNIKDPLILWAAAGVIGVITRDIYSYFAKEIGFAKFYIWLVGSALLVEKPEVTTFWGNIIGFLVDIVVGSLLGVAIAFLIKWRGRSYYIFKRLGVRCSSLVIYVRTTLS